MFRQPRSQAWGYGIAIVAVLVASIVRLAMESFAGPHDAFGTFLLAVAVVSWFRGVGPALLTFLLGGLIGLGVYFQPIQSPGMSRAADWIALASYAVVGGLLVGFGHRKRNASRHRSPSRIELGGERGDRQGFDQDARLSEQRFRRLADTMPQILWAAGPDGVVESFNGRWYEYTGMATEDALSREGWLSAVHPEDQPRIRSLRDQAFGKGDLLEAEVRLRRNDATYRWHLIRSVPVRDDSGRLLQRFGTATDIDDRKRTEERLRGSEERLRLALQAARMGTWYWEIQNDRIDWSDNLVEVLGVSRGTFNASVEGFRQLIHPEDRDRVENAVSRALSERSGDEIEFRVCRPDGSVVWLLGKGKVESDADNHPVRMLGLVMDITARKQADRERSGLLTRLTTLVDNTPLGVIEWDAQFVVTRWSGQAEKLFGWSAAEVIGKRIDEFPLLFEDGERVESILGQLLDPSNRFVVAQNRNRSRSGEELSCEWYNSVLHDESGRMVAVLSLVLDVTERCRIEERLRSERERVQLVADAVPALMSYIDANACYVMNNRSYETWFALRRETVVGKHMSEVLGESAWKTLRPHVEMALAGNVVSYESEVPYRDGGTRWISATYTPDLGEGGLVRGFVAHVTDITERHLREEQLRESEARFRQLAEAMPQIVWVADQAGQIRYLSRHWSEYTGMPTEKGMGDQWVECVHRDDRPGMLSRWEEAIREGTPYRTEYRLRDKNGIDRWHLVRGVPVRDDAGRVVRWYGSITDIDEPKRLAEALQDADRRKDEFLATLAHELRNPLAPIRHAVALLRKQGPPDPELQAYRDVIDRQIGNMARLLDDLLDVSRITSNKLELRCETIDLASIVQMAVETSRPLIEAGGHELVVDLPSESIMLDADPTRLSQIFSNLLNNAAKYSDEAGRITLSVHQHEGQVDVSVRDTGIGIDAEHLSRIFEIFSQVEPALHRSQGGLGIGLALVRGLVQLHGGTVEARSDGPGAGSEFIVHLPLARPGARTTPTERTEEPATFAITRLLLVDDHLDSAQTLGKLLALSGLEVQVVHDGRSALSVIEPFQPEVVVLDIGLPDMDGYEVARQIRKQPGGASRTLIALTGWGQASDRLRSREAGFDTHLVKPVDPDELLDFLRTLNPKPIPA
ncbi:hybrid sensor histidine kinase/response regulator [Tautonia marina]|uniref:hybrid sensor histidine kinase/response regulator n=1 Tax=Tautonia marina TaxID=2653855 RepID=UPI00126076FE|nr:PAS domain S-box protein [Tautonia marina]